MFPENGLLAFVERQTDDTWMLLDCFDQLLLGRDGEAAVDRDESVRICFFDSRCFMISSASSSFIPGIRLFLRWR